MILAFIVSAAAVEFLARGDDLFRGFTTATSAMRLIQMVIPAIVGTLVAAAWWWLLKRTRAQTAPKSAHPLRESLLVGMCGALLQMASSWTLYPNILTPAWDFFVVDTRLVIGVAMGLSTFAIVTPAWHIVQAARSKYSIAKGSLVGLVAAWASPALMVWIVFASQLRWQFGNQLSVQWRSGESGPIGLVLAFSVTCLQTMYMIALNVVINGWFLGPLWIAAGALAVTVRTRMAGVSVGSAMDCSAYPAHGIRREKVTRPSRFL